MCTKKEKKNYLRLKYIKVKMVTYFLNLFFFDILINLRGSF